MMNEVMGENEESIDRGIGIHGNRLTPGVPPIETWTTPAEVGWVPTTLLEPYRTAAAEYEIYLLVAPLVAEFFLSAALAWYLMDEGLKKYGLGFLLLALLLLVAFLGAQLYRYRKERDRRWDAIEKAKRVRTYTTAETGPPTDLWRYDFIDHLFEAEEEGGPGTVIEPHLRATCGQESKRSIFEHPPADPNQFSMLTYNLVLPRGTHPLKLEGFIGIETEIATPDGPRPSERAQDNGVLFEILINDQRAWRVEKYSSEWEPFSIAVPWRARLSICFITGCLRTNIFNWAVWGEPRLVELAE